MLSISFILIQVLKHLSAVKKLITIGIHAVEMAPQLLRIRHAMAGVKQSYLFLIEEKALPVPGLFLRIQPKPTHNKLP